MTFEVVFLGRRTPPRIVSESYFLGSVINKPVLRLAVGESIEGRYGQGALHVSVERIS